MAIQTKEQIEKALTTSAERSRKVREAAQAIKEARQLSEQESSQRTVSLIRPPLSPLAQRQR